MRKIYLSPVQRSFISACLTKQVLVKCILLIGIGIVDYVAKAILFNRAPVALEVESAIAIIVEILMVVELIPTMLTLCNFYRNSLVFTPIGKKFRRGKLDCQIGQTEPTHYFRISILFRALVHLKEGDVE